MWCIQWSKFVSASCCLSLCLQLRISMFLRYTHCCISQCITSDTCVRFADNQPAPKGNVAGHCGGPGSLTTCVYFAAMYMGEDNPENYNIISFDQRGMGRSEPTFVVEECLLKTYDPMNNASLAVGKLLLCRLVDCIELDCKSISSLIYSSTQITTTRIPFAILPKFTKRGTLGVGSILDFR